MLMTSRWGQDEMTYYLRTDEGDRYRLAFCDGLALQDLAPNTRVTVQYQNATDGVLDTCQLPVVEGRRRRLFSGSIAPPLRPTFLVYITTLCNSAGEAAASVEDVQNLFNNNGGKSVASYYDTCSSGQVTVDPSQLKVVGPIRIPCSGSVPGVGSFVSTSCDNDNMINWHSYLDVQARAQGIVPTDYNHKIMILPRGFPNGISGCGASVGSSSVGPWLRTLSAKNNWGTGLVWINGDSFAAGDIEILFHEMGHNMMMAHANIPGNCGSDGNDQCDNTCPMGAAGGQGIRCLNAAHAWQLGWGQLSREFVDADMGYGAAQPVQLPAQLSNSQRAVSVTLGSQPRFFIAARINAPPYDLPFTKALNDKPFVLVHSYTGTPANQYQRTFLLATLAPGDRYTDAASGLVVAFTAWSDGAGASATLCRRRGSREQVCGDGMDDDCDGLDDASDPDCQGRMNGEARALSPPPPSPPPPPSRSTGTGDIEGGTTRRPPSPKGASSPPPPRPPPRPPSSPPPPSPPRKSPPPSPPPTAAAAIASTAAAPEKDHATTAATAASSAAAASGVQC
ncbi:Autolysin [Tetrabaena socialis]|uniref:Autolysin n=1 Tax=Tetrabaena socialis TaxID=47790 RepID=A0A2J8A5Y4_9CHLO|nr:Autolysin [Tetrabaena socialis]|eukprot:PNH07942.1 Autolysin [Tetrabaena socialis]